MAQKEDEHVNVVWRRRHVTPNEVVLCSVNNELDSKCTMDVRATHLVFKLKSSKIL